MTNGMPHSIFSHSGVCASLLSQRYAITDQKNGNNIIFECCTGPLTKLPPFVRLNVLHKLRMRIGILACTSVFTV